MISQCNGWFSLLTLNTLTRVEKNEDYGQGLEDEGKPVENVKNEEQNRKGLEKKLINPEKYESMIFT